MSAHTDTHRRPTRRAAWIAAIAAVPVALLVSGLAVAGGSYSAFSATTSNPTNNWTTGSVILSDDDGSNSGPGVAMFTASNLKPGSTGTKCIAVTSTGTLASAVKLYATAAATGTLGSYVQLSVEQGTGGGYSSCTGFTSASTLYTGTVSGFASAYTGYSNGIATWSPTGSGSESRVFRFTYTIDSATPNTLQSATAGLGFTWEAQNS